MPVPHAISRDARVWKHKDGKKSKNLKGQNTAFLTPKSEYHLVYENLSALCSDQQKKRVQFSDINLIDSKTIVQMQKASNVIDDPIPAEPISVVKGTLNNV